MTNDRPMDRLRDKLAVGRDGMALCPAHDDHDPSLSVRETEDGTVLLNCFAGCTPEEVLAAVGLSKRDLFPQKNGHKKKRKIKAVYDYQGEDGTVVFQAVRFDPKGFAQRQSEKHWSMEGVRTVPYRLPKVVEAATAGELVAVAEGEEDVHALERAGFVATCSPAGAGKWKGEYSEHLRGASVAVLPDNDKPGRRHAEQVAEYTHGKAESVRVVELPGLGEGGDVRDWLDNGGTGAELRRLIADAPVWKPGKENGRRGPISAADLLAKEFPPIQWAVPGLVPEGVTILAGKPKMGKSWMALGLAVAVASGGYALGTVQVGKGEALYLGLEDSERRLKSRLQKVLNGSGPPPGLALHTEWPNMGEGGADRLDEWLTEHPDTKLVVIDTLKKVRPRSSGNRSIYDVDYEALEPLLPIAAKHGTAILVIHHLNKLGESDDPFDMISGSTGLTGGVDGALVLMRKRGSADAVLVADGRDIEESSKLALKWDQPLASWTLIGDAEEHVQSEIRQDILRALADAGESMGARDVADAIGRDYETVRQRLYQMSKAGEVRVPNRGCYSAVTSHNNIHNNRNGDNSRNSRNGAPDATDRVNVTDVMDVTAGLGVTNSPEIRKLMQMGMSEDMARHEVEGTWPELADPEVDDDGWEDVD